MKRYFRLQLKRIMKTAPLAVALCLILAMGFGLILLAVSSTDSSEKTAKARIAQGYDSVTIGLDVSVMITAYQEMVAAIKGE